MIDYSKVDSFIFDLDGTLWDSTDGIVATWNEVLKSYPDIKETVTAANLSDCFGLPLEEIARKLFVTAPEELRQRAMLDCCELENSFLAQHGGVLYPRLFEVLDKLSKRYTLAVVSNCQTGYIESFYTAHGTQKFFKDYECMGATGRVKGENIRLVIERNSLKNSVYVGDTQGDADAAALAGIPFVYASYGFGSVSYYDDILGCFEDLLKITHIA